MYAKSGVMFAGSSAFSGRGESQKWGKYTFVRGGLQSTINYGADEMLKILGFTMKILRGDAPTTSNPKMDCSDELAKALVKGLKGIKIHTNTIEGNGTKVYPLTLGINALPNHLIEWARQFAKDNCEFTPKAETAFDTPVDDSNPGCLINIIKKYDVEYFNTSVAPLMRADYKTRRQPAETPGEPKPDVDVVTDTFKIDDIAKKYPYADLKDAQYDLLRVMRVLNNAKEIFMMKKYDSLHKIHSIEYVNEDSAKARLSKVKVAPRDPADVAKITEITKIGLKKYVTLWDIFMDKPELYHVDGLAFYDENPNVFNFFRGYQYSTLETVKTEVIQPFLDHIHDIIADGDENVYTYIIKWIASVLQTPNHKTEIALVLLGRQGTGKNVFTNAICELMSRYALKNCEHIENIVGKFNATLENKKLIILNEVESADTSKHLNSDVLKSLITDKFMTINEKNIPVREAENVANFIICSNHNTPIKIEDSDRRYMVTRTNDKFAGNRAHFKAMTEKFTPEFYENLFTYFMIQNIKGFTEEPVPETDEKRNIKSASTSVYDLFIRACYEDIVDVTGPELYSIYKRYCEGNGYCAAGSRTMLAQIKQYTGDTKGKYICDKKAKVYNIKPEYIAQFKAEDDAIVVDVCEGTEIIKDIVE